MSRGLCLLAAGLLVLAGMVPAEATGPVHAGVKGGWAMANQTDDGELADARNGLSVGGWVGVPVSPIITIQPEALFTMKGDREQDAGTTKLDYIEVPVLAKLGFQTSSPAQPSLFLGPAVGFNVSAKTEIESGPLAGEFDVKDQTNSVDFGMVFGGGVDFPMGSNSIGLDVRYNLGLSNVADSALDSTSKNNVLTIMGSISFI